MGTQLRVQRQIFFKSVGRSNDVNVHFHFHCPPVGLRRGTREDGACGLLSPNRYFTSLFLSEVKTSARGKGLYREEEQKGATTPCGPAAVPVDNCNHPQNKPSLFTPGVPSWRDYAMIAGCSDH